MQSPRIQPPAVAGRFYDQDPARLSQAVQGFIAAGQRQARQRQADQTQAGQGADQPQAGKLRQAGAAAAPRPQALIAPHAGYVFSGPVAGSAYAALADHAAEIEQVVLLGPPHRLPVRGLATSSASAFETPLGQVPVDQAALDRLIAMHPQIQRLDAAFAGEHCIEVQLPFLQVLLERFRLLPFLVGTVDAAQVAEILAPFWEAEDSLIVVSSDLSHYLDYATAQALDARTSEAIRALHPERIAPEQACGQSAIAGLLTLARARQAQGRILDLRNSGDTAGPRDHVVGYGAYVFS
ncbi:MAG: AmmeMemoRadiSam system protein B [Halochromatium sp.]|uniref:AmmeMemoRadiSam system protein B n=1 Tax=Halochromatium sp. TaxID=2049430 RepID=UPI00397CEA48